MTSFEVMAFAREPHNPSALLILKVIATTVAAGVCVWEYGHKLQERLARPIKVWTIGADEVRHQIILSHRSLKMLSNSP